MICTLGGRFPRGWLQLTFVTKNVTKVDLQLILFPLESPPAAPITRFTFFNLYILILLNHYAPLFKYESEWSIDEITVV